MAGITWKIALSLKHINPFLTLIILEKRLKKPLPKFSIQPDSSPPVSAPRDLDKRTNITIGDRIFEVEADDLETLGRLGQGAYGTVDKMRHRLTGTIMAVKVRTIIKTLKIFFL